MAITQEQIDILNRLAGGPAGKVQLGTLIQNAETITASEIPLADGSVLIGNASAIAVANAVSGDISLSNAGVAAIASGVIVNADVSGSAAIDYSKMATMTGDVSMTANASAIGAAKVTVAMLAAPVMKEATGTITNTHLLALSTPVTLIAAGGAGTVHIVDEIELFHSYSTAAYATGADVQIEYETSGANIALVVDTFVTNASSASVIIKPSTYDLDGVTGSAAGFDVTANANKAVQVTGSNFTDGNAANIVKFRIRYHTVTLLT